MLKPKEVDAKSGVTVEMGEKSLELAFTDLLKTPRDLSLVEGVLVKLKPI